MIISKITNLLPPDRTLSSQPSVVPRYLAGIKYKHIIPPNPREAFGDSLSSSELLRGAKKALHHISALPTFCFEVFAPVEPSMSLFTPAAFMSTLPCLHTYCVFCLEFPSPPCLLEECLRSSKIHLPCADFQMSS